MTERAERIIDILNTLPRPKPVPCSAAIRAWWESTALPLLKDQALSELRRNDAYPPRLIGFMDDNSMGMIDVGKAFGAVPWGDGRSKDITARVHQLSARIPGVKAAVFCSEAWAATLKGRRREDLPDNLGDWHDPDRKEVMMWSMLHHDWSDNTMMQLQTMVDVLRVLGTRRSRTTWAETKYGTATTDDPMTVMTKGRFIYNDKENDT